jgi:hypothetical protein
MSNWSTDNFREWVTTLVGAILILVDAGLVVFGVWSGPDHTWDLHSSGAALLMLMAGLWLLGIKDFDPTKYLNPFK